MGGGVTKVRRSVVEKVEKVQCGQPKIENISCFIRPQIPKAGKKSVFRVQMPTNSDISGSAQ